MSKENDRRAWMPLGKFKICPICLWRQHIYRSKGRNASHYNGADICTECKIPLRVLVEEGPPPSRPNTTQLINTGIPKPLAQIPTGEAYGVPDAAKPKSSKRKHVAEDLPAHSQSTLVVQPVKRTKIEKAAWCFRCKAVNHDPSTCTGAPDQGWRKVVDIDLGWHKFWHISDDKLAMVAKMEPKTTKQLMDHIQILISRLTMFIQFSEARDKILKAFKESSLYMSMIFGAEDPQGDGHVFEKLYTRANRSDYSLMQKVVATIYKIWKEQVTVFFGQRPSSFKSNKVWNQEISRRLSTQADKIRLKEDAVSAFKSTLNHASAVYTKDMDKIQKECFIFLHRDMDLAQMRILFLPTLYMHLIFDVTSEDSWLPLFDIPDVYDQPSTYQDANNCMQVDIQLLEIMDAIWTDQEAAQNTAETLDVKMTAGDDEDLHVHLEEVMGFLRATAEQFGGSLPPTSSLQHEVLPGDDAGQDPDHQPDDNNHEDSQLSDISLGSNDIEMSETLKSLAIEKRRLGNLMRLMSQD
ncbi:hypothetical protein H2198_006881 [Neophaeococcomyces mojaviensis]|uniref:Uncharacterized protein n=1 Tax=Neophaeococcomyces mojaviensis TaxID=3383035 RepID=A0ACC3A2D5_9EURO|nr:hypothetical protein H2198_006881 [Knufia sp. JES_112]